MQRLYLLGLAAAIGMMTLVPIPAFARGGHGGHGHGAHRSHGHGGHGHHVHAHAAHAHRSVAHAGRRGAKNHHRFALHNRQHLGHHAAWAHHYANHWHGWNHHNGWGYHHGWGGWGWGGWNWYGGGMNVVGPTVVNPDYVNPGVIVAPQNVPPLTMGGFYSILGTIRTINGNAVSVTPFDGDPITVNTTSETKIVLNSRPSTLDDLLPSDRVKVRYNKSLKAMTLVALRK